MRGWLRLNVQQEPLYGGDSQGERSASRVKVRGRALGGGTSMCKGPGVARSLAGEPVSSRRLACFCLISVWIGTSLSPLRSPVQPSQQDLEIPDTPVHIVENLQG